MVENSPYAILGCSPSSSDADIKRSYRRLVLQYHPDKSKGKDFAQKKSFSHIQEAWETLRDSESRRAYDASVERRQCAEAAVRMTSVRDEKDLDEFDFCEESRIFHCSCRCGGEITISEKDLEEGYDVAGCSSCSILVKVSYEDAPTEEEGEDDDNMNDG
eukprot:g3559.t1